MTRFQGSVLLGVLVVVVVLVVGSYSQQREGPDEAQPADLALEQPSHHTQLQLSLGRRDTEQVEWQGEISVSEGRVLAVEVLAAARNAQVEGHRFAVRAARQAAKKKQQKKNVTLEAARLRVLLDAPPSATVHVNTSRGEFAFTLAQIPLGAEQLQLDGNAAVVREEGSLCLTTAETEDDFPLLAKAPDGTIWLAYVEYRKGPQLVDERVLAGQFDALIPEGHGDQIKLVRFDGAAWQPALDVTQPQRDIWRPTMTVDKQGRVWVMWAEKVDGDWEIMSRWYAPDQQRWSKPTQVTTAPGSDFHCVAAGDAAGRVWLAWQGWRGDNYEILLASADAESGWTEPETISRSAANDWSPAIAADSAGHVFVAWDTYDQGNYDVLLYRRGGGAEARRLVVADSPRFEARVELACDEADRLWIAYEQGDAQWGKDYVSDNNYQRVGFDRNPGFALYVNRTVRVKCLAGGELQQPSADLQAALDETLSRNESVPQLGFDESGGVWLLVRHHPQSGGGGETWHSFASRYDGRAWSQPRHLTNSANLLDNRPALLAHDGGLLAVYSGDYRTQTRNRQQDDLFSAILRPEGETHDPQLIAAQPPAAPDIAPVHPAEAEAVARLRSFRLESGGRRLQLVRGEFHRHTEYTSHRDQDGLLEDAWRYGLDAGRLDWMGDGDHDNGFGHEYMWWQIQKISDLHHNPPHFVAAMTYERSLQYPNGHRNVMMPRRGIRPLPRGSLDSSPEAGTVDTKILYAYLKHFGGICASHTSGTNMGTDWRDNDPEVEPVVEIYQGHRHNYEHFDAPRSATAETQIGGYRPAGFVWNALEKGYRLGFQSSSDHVSTHMSYAIVLAEQNARQAIIDAFRRRHCYAATDNILLVVRSGQHLMGDQFTSRERPALDIQVHGTAPLARVHVVRDNEYVYTAEPGQAEARLSYTDMDARPGGTSYYYVRVEQEDGNLAWASPLWITYEP